MGQSPESNRKRPPVGQSPIGQSPIGQAPIG